MNEQAVEALIKLIEHCSDNILLAIHHAVMEEICERDFLMTAVPSDEVNKSIEESEKGKGIVPSLNEEDYNNLANIVAEFGQGDEGRQKVMEYLSQKLKDAFPGKIGDVFIDGSRIIIKGMIDGDEAFQHNVSYNRSEDDVANLHYPYEGLIYTPIDAKLKPDLSIPLYHDEGDLQLCLEDGLDYPQKYFQIRKETFKEDILMFDPIIKESILEAGKNDDLDKCFLVHSVVDMKSMNFDEAQAISVKIVEPLSFQENFRILVEVKR